MQRANHWFVACGHGAELRVSAWSAGKRLRAGAKHLCGQTCLHKLVDEFLARTVSTPAQPASAECIAPAALAAHKSQPSRAVLPAAPSENLKSTKQPDVYIDEFESSARLIAQPESPTPANDAATHEPPIYATRNWRAEAWKRERERVLRGDSRASSLTAHRRNIA
jgi:hypothetical protein